MEAQCRIPTPEAEALMSQADMKQLEQEALKLRTKRPEATLQELHTMLQQFSMKNTGHSRRNQENSSDYQVFRYVRLWESLWQHESFT